MPKVSIWLTVGTVLIACSLASGCSKQKDNDAVAAATPDPGANGPVGHSLAGATATATNTAGGVTATGETGGGGGGTPVLANASEPAGPAMTGQLAQTAALSPLANSNGTVPASPGVGPAGGFTVASAATPGSTTTGSAVAPGGLGRNGGVTAVGGARGSTSVLGGTGPAAASAASVGVPTAAVTGATSTGAVAGGAAPR